MKLEEYRALQRKPKRRRVQHEERLQKQVVAALNLLVKPPARFWHVPNASKVPQHVGTGLTPGVHDLHFVWNNPYPALPLVATARFGTIELKVGKNKLTPEQMQFARDLEACGHRWAECRSVDEVLATLREWGVIR